jgi:hypothetical protein
MDNNNNRVLLPEIEAAIRMMHPRNILFFGDADTATNLLFSRSALFLAQAVRPLPAYLPRLCVAGSHGFDDLKEACQNQFSHQLDQPRYAQGSAGLTLYVRSFSSPMEAIPGRFQNTEPPATNPNS